MSLKPISTTLLQSCVSSIRPLISSISIPPPYSYASSEQLYSLPPPPYTTPESTWGKFIEHHCDVTGHYDRGVISRIDSHTPPSHTPISSTLISSLLSYPLTLSHHLPTVKSVTVLGARKEAMLPPRYWPRSLSRVSFVGPSCPSLPATKFKDTNFEYKTGFLEHPPPQSSSSHAVVMYHPGLGHSRHSNSWTSTLSLLKDHALQTRQPLMFTHYSTLDLNRDLPVIERTFGCEDANDFVVEVGENCWMDLKP
eukprot:CAMPEP_0118635360 /NCGR_PEP_ID=MMETSP0785-20121206/2034_1 /TAXON_ID=91992 /ORGANISM="Bolidomonas pacifica, Strain CCMP 1866" /LENGTH=252 /DNA_ID=CAMNT_0006526387 /DNA_START=145 /DNA_END=900 /DNA_ORIENTATION=-